MSNIHSTAVLDPSVEVADSASVGAFCVLGADVKLAENVVLENHVSIAGRTTIGAGSRIFPFVSIHTVPQDLKYKGEKSRVEIGKDTCIREHATIHAGTKDGGMLTKIGDRVLIMSGVHIAHDVKIHDNVIVASNTALGGHVEIEANAIISGNIGIHQKVRIGTFAFVSYPRIERDIPPFAHLGRFGYSGKPNLRGFHRQKYKLSELTELQAAFDKLFGNKQKPERQRQAEYSENLKALVRECEQAETPNPLVQTLVAFLEAETRRATVDGMMFRHLADDHED